MSKGHPKTLPKSCSVKSYVTGPSTKSYFNEFSIHAGSSHMIKHHKSTVVMFQSAMVSRFLKTIKVTMKHDPFDAMYESM